MPAPAAQRISDDACFDGRELHSDDGVVCLESEGAPATQRAGVDQENRRAIASLPCEAGQAVEHRDERRGGIEGAQASGDTIGAAKLRAYRIELAPGVSGLTARTIGVLIQLLDSVVGRVQEALRLGELLQAIVGGEPRFVELAPRRGCLRDHLAGAPPEGLHLGVAGGELMPDGLVVVTPIVQLLTGRRQFRAHRVDILTQAVDLGAHLGGAVAERIRVGSTGGELLLDGLVLLPPLVQLLTRRCELGVNGGDLFTQRIDLRGSLRPQLAVLPLELVLNELKLPARFVAHFRRAALGSFGGYAGVRIGNGALDVRRRRVEVSLELTGQRDEDAIERSPDLIVNGRHG